jgi:hypothetical protein
MLLASLPRKIIQLQLTIPEWESIRAKTHHSRYHSSEFRVQVKHIRAHRRVGDLASSTKPHFREAITTKASSILGWAQEARTLSLGTTASLAVLKSSESVSDCDVSPPLRNAAPRSSRSRAIFVYSSARRAGMEAAPPGVNQEKKSVRFHNSMGTPDEQIASGRERG